MIHLKQKTVLKQSDPYLVQSASSSSKLVILEPQRPGDPMGLWQDSPTKSTSRTAAASCNPIYCASVPNVWKTALESKPPCANSMGPQVFTGNSTMCFRHVNLQQVQTEWVVASVGEMAWGPGCPAVHLSFQLVAPWVLDPTRGPVWLSLLPDPSREHSCSLCQGYPAVDPREDPGVRSCLQQREALPQALSWL
jgi:hypothetical protein